MGITKLFTCVTSPPASRQITHVVGPEIQNKHVVISPFVLTLSPVLRRLLFHAEKEVDGREGFRVFGIARRMKLNVTLSGETGGEREL